VHRKPQFCSNCYCSNCALYRAHRLANGRKHRERDNLRFVKARMGKATARGEPAKAMWGEGRSGVSKPASIDPKNVIAMASFVFPFALLVRGNKAAGEIRPKLEVFDEKHLKPIRYTCV